MQGVGEEEHPELDAADGGLAPRCAPGEGEGRERREARDDHERWGSVLIVRVLMVGDSASHHAVCAREGEERDDGCSSRCIALTNIAYAAPMARSRYHAAAPHARPSVVPRCLDVEVIPRARGSLASARHAPSRRSRGDATHDRVVRVEVRVRWEEDVEECRVLIPYLIEEEVALREYGMAACASALDC